jgi:pullulanase/glycogen debranching enzyme
MLKAAGEGQPMPITVTTERAKDRLCLEEFELSEDAINTVSTMLGFTLTDLLAEEEKENPDKKIIEELKEKLSKIYDERLEIYGGNTEMKYSVIERYSDYIRERVANA